MLIALCVFSAFLGRFVFLLRPFDNDAAIFIYMGQMVSTGGRLCHDLIDNKFPTVGLMTSVIYKAFGICWPAYVALQTVLSVTTAFILSRAAARVCGPSARLPTLLFALVYLNFTRVVFAGFQLETIQVFFTALAASAGIEMILTNSRTDAFVAGLCAGCGMMLKPTAGGVLLAILIGTIIQHRRIAVSLLCMLAGLCIPLAVAFIYLVSADLLRDMPALYQQISIYAKQSVFGRDDLLKPVIAFGLLAFPLLVRGYIFRRQRDTQTQKPEMAIILFLLIWLTLETAGIIFQRRMYAYHFLPMIPPVALIFGMLRRSNRASVLAGALAPIAIFSILQAAYLLPQANAAEPRLAVSDYLNAHAKPGDAAWMDCWPRLMLETGLRPATRLPFTFLFTNYDNAGLDYSAGMIADFERAKPAYIILPVPMQEQLDYQTDYLPELAYRPVRKQNYIIGWHRIEQYTLDHYVKETMVGNNAVYHRRGE
jgi:hypothetical protein